MCVFGFLPVSAMAIARALEPDTLTTPIPPAPCGVAMAAIVSLVGIIPQAGRSAIACRRVMIHCWSKPSPPLTA